MAAKCSRISERIRSITREAVMQSRRGAVLATALVFTGMMASDALAQRRDSDWIVLGCQTVSFRVDRDVLRVGRRDGRFAAIRLNARGGDVEMLDLKVI